MRIWCFLFCVFLLACQKEEPRADPYAERRVICGGLAGWDYYLCVRPDLQGKFDFLTKLRADLIEKNDTRYFRILDFAHQRSGEVFEYCTREVGVAEDCVDEALQAEIDMIWVEGSKVDEDGFVAVLS